MSDVKVYNISRLSLILGGIPLDSGFAEDDVFTFTPEGPAYGDKKGADGEVTRYATNEKRFTLKIKLMQSSDGNAKLSALLTLGLLAANGSDVVALYFKDNQGTTLVAAGKCWLTGFPEMVFGGEVKEREWEGRGVSDVMFCGGN
jgi:hypothetical protein